MNKKLKITLDTSCFFCYIQDEEGSNLFEDILNQAKASKIELYISRVNYCEILYQIKRLDKNGYKKIKEILDNLPISIVDTNQEICEFASTVKSKGKISLGDSFAIGTSQFLGGSVATTDRHEFSKWESQVEILWLR